MTQILTFRYICSIFLFIGMLVSSSPTWAKVQYWPTGIQLGVDAFRPFYYKYYGRQGTQYELNASMAFARLILEGDYGWGDVKWEGDNKKISTKSSYTNKGQYFRIGLNYNLIQDTPDKNMAFLGLRYASSFFKDHLISKVNHDGESWIRYGKIPINSNQSNVWARWFEVVAGVKVKVWKLLYVGGTLRYKFSLRLHRADSHVPYDILGWGLNDDDEPFGFNLYLSLRIPFGRNTMPDNSQE